MRPSSTMASAISRASASGSASRCRFATRSGCRPDWARPSTSPAPRISKSVSAMANPSSVCSIATRRSAASGVFGSASKKQNPRYAPRPMRPRSWCSWDSPNCPASEMIISDAFGTSTPTSITVVETSTGKSPTRKASITRCRSSRSSRPWTRPTDSVPNARRILVASSSAPACDSSPSMRGATTYSCRPSASCSLMNLHIFFRCGCVITRAVVTGCRPGGRSVIRVTSRSPNCVRQSDRGIGVAVITSTCGAAPSCENAARWATPNLCCSSMTTSPSRSKKTLS